MQLDPSILKQDEPKERLEKLKTLNRLRQKGRVCPFKFANQLWFADGRHVLFWPRKNTLIVSDLHFGKGQSLNRYGNFIPTHDTASTLMFLQKVIQDYQPAHVIALGDSFHDKHVVQDMGDTDNEKLTWLCQRMSRWTWILGNHDEDMPHIWPGEYKTSLTSEGVAFLHEPESEPTYQIVGHFHPKYKVCLRGTSVSGRCFVKDNHTLIMPSFGSYTGGLSIEDVAIRQVFDSAINGVYLCYQQRVYNIGI